MKISCRIFHYSLYFPTCNSSTVSTVFPVENYVYNVENFFIGKAVEKGCNLSTGDVEEKILSYQGLSPVFHIQRPLLLLPLQSLNYYSMLS